MKRSDLPMLAVLHYCKQWGERPWLTPGALERLALDGWPMKIALARIRQAVALGLVEYGTSEAYCWPTQAGHDVLSGKSENRWDKVQA